MNVEKHRNYITTHRVDTSWSALYAALEEVFISIAEGKDQGCLKEKLFKMNKKEKELMENYLFVRNSGLLFNRTNVDVNGKCTMQDPETGMDIMIGDGIMPQIERFASKYFFNKLTVEVFNTVISAMNDKAKDEIGNHYLFICNTRMWNMIQNTLGDYLAKFRTDGAYLWSQKANDYVKVGAAFDSYSYSGNTIQFRVDRAFSREYGNDKAYAVCLDLTADHVGSTAPITMFTLKGGDMISNKFEGVGLSNGLSSGNVSSPVAGSKAILWGYSGVAVFNPYRSFILGEV